jgi:predicted NBD/HSP70 family sugar kinase
MAVAGLINIQKQIVEFSPDFHWHNADIKNFLSSRCEHPPIVFDNVSRVMALGELWYGIGKKYKNFICVNVGYGIGAGIIIDGKPLLGLKGIAGEFGHVTLDKDSRARCECGNYGCLEALSSGRAIALNAQNELNKGKKSVLFDLCQGKIESVTAEMVVRAAKQDDDLSKKIFDNAIEYLGIGIAGLVNLFHPEVVVIGGGVAQSGDILFDSVRQIVKMRTMESIAKDVKIIPTTFPKKTAVKGAVSLILSEVLNLSYQNN